MTKTAQVAGVMDELVRRVVRDVAVQDVPGLLVNADPLPGSLGECGDQRFEAPVLHTAGFENVYLRASMHASRQTTALTGRAVVDVVGICDDFSSKYGSTVLRSSLMAPGR